MHVTNPIVLSLNCSDLRNFVLLSSISDVHQPLSQIRISLAGSLGAGQMIFLAGIGAKDSTVRSLNFERVAGDI